MAVAMPVNTMPIEEAYPCHLPTWNGAARDFYAIFGTLPVRNPSLGYLCILRSRLGAICDIKLQLESNELQFSPLARETLASYTLDGVSSTIERATELLGHFGYAAQIEAMEAEFDLA